jgi:hypothetical protein
MTRFSLGLFMLITAANFAAAAPRLRVTRASAPGLVPDALIVGRATCRGATWLLTETSKLVEVANADWTVTVRSIRGLRSSDKIWGLACLSDGTLWTLPSPETVARLDRSGEIVERISVPLPRVALFAAGDRLLFQQLPILPNVAALATSPPRQPATSRVWPGLVGRDAKRREDQIARNLVNCGLSRALSVPCWFADDPRFTISDGTSVSTVVSPAGTPPADRAAPIWDVALTSADRYWLLATSAAGPGPRAGARLFRAHERSGEQLSLELEPLARLVLSATESRCLLLTATGSVMEVVVQP